jgi:heterodisulfide reductase subunit B
MHKEMTPTIWNKLVYFHRKNIVFFVKKRMKLNIYICALVADYGLKKLFKKATQKLISLNCAAFYGCYLS